MPAADSVISTPLITASSREEGRRPVLAGPGSGLPAGLAAADELPGGQAAADGLPGGATRANRPDHPSPSRAAIRSHTDTSRHPATRGSTNNNGGRPR
jgi:hypothetical protein